VSLARDPFWSVVIVTAFLPIFLTVCYFFVSQVAIKIIDKTQLNQGSLQKVSFLPFPFFPQYFVRDFEIRGVNFFPVPIQRNISIVYPVYFPSFLLTHNHIPTYHSKREIKPSIQLKTPQS